MFEVRFRRNRLFEEKVNLDEENIFETFQSIKMKTIQRKNQNLVVGLVWQSQCQLVKSTSRQ